MEIGLTLAPRGIGTLFAMLLLGRIVNRLDPRPLIFTGLLLCAFSSFLLSRMTIQSDSMLPIAAGIVQGIGSSIIFVPLTTMAFATLHARYRSEAAAFNTLTRNMGASVGISVVQALTIRNTQIVHSRLVEGLRPDSPAFGLMLPDFDFYTASSVASLDHQAVRQAMMVAYMDTFWGLCIMGVLAAPLVLLLRSSK